MRINFDTPAPVYAKLEYLNPSGSLKDRSASYMIEYAEKKWSAQVVELLLMHHLVIRVLQVP